MLYLSIRRRAASCEYQHIAGYIACMVFITVYLFTMVRSCGVLYSSIRCKAASFEYKHIVGYITCMVFFAVYFFAVVLAVVC